MTADRPARRPPPPFPGSAPDDHRCDLDDPPNVVLRGGPFDGATVRVATLRSAIERRGGGRRHRYRPTAEVDDEFPTLLIFVYDGSVEDWH